MMVRDIAAEDLAACRSRDREPEEEVDVGTRRGELELLSFGMGEGGGGGGDMSGGRRARLLARMGIGRRSVGLRTILLALPGP